MTSQKTRPPNKKEARKKKLSNLKEALQVKKDVTVEKAKKAYELFRCFVDGKAQTNWDRIVNEKHTKNPWVGVNGRSNKGLCVCSWISFMDCIKLHKLTVFPADAAEKQRYYMQQTIKKPQRVMARQFVSRMGVLNDYLAYLPTVYDSSMAIASTKKMNVPFNEAELINYLRVGGVSIGMGQGRAHLPSFAKRDANDGECIPCSEASQRQSTVCEAHSILSKVPKGVDELPA